MVFNFGTVEFLKSPTEFLILMLQKIKKSNILKEKKLNTNIVCMYAARKGRLFHNLEYRMTFYRTLSLWNQFINFPRAHPMVISIKKRVKRSTLWWRSKESMEETTFVSHIHFIPRRCTRSFFLFLYAYSCSLRLDLATPK